MEESLKLRVTNLEEEVHELKRKLDSLENLLKHVMKVEQLGSKCVTPLEAKRDLDATNSKILSKSLTFCNY